METEQQKWLINYLVTSNFVVEDHGKLASLISGMTATEILKAMEIAKDIQKELSSTGLGKELL